MNDCQSCETKQKEINRLREIIRNQIDFCDEMKFNNSCSDDLYKSTSNDLRQLKDFIQDCYEKLSNSPENLPYILEQIKKEINL